MEISYNTRKNILFVITALIVAYVRTKLQYGHSWGSLWDFLISWLIHYFALALFIMVAYVCIKGTESFFLGYKKEEGLSIEDAIIYVSLVVLVAAILIFFFAHYTPDEYYEDYNS